MIVSCDTEISQQFCFLGNAIFHKPTVFQSQSFLPKDWKPSNNVKQLLNEKKSKLASANHKVTQSGDNPATGNINTPESKDVPNVIIRKNVDAAQTVIATKNCSSTDKCNGDTCTIEDVESVKSIGTPDADNSDCILTTKASDETEEHITHPASDEDGNSVSNTITVDDEPKTDNIVLSQTFTHEMLETKN